MISKEFLESVISEYDFEIKNASIIERSIFSRLEDSLKLEEASVVTGIRMSGKTCALFFLAKKHGGTYVNFENEKLIDFSLEDFDKLLSIVIERGAIAQTKSNSNDCSFVLDSKTLMKSRETLKSCYKFLFLDEVQNVAGWEKFVNRAYKKVKIIVTGSNSSLLSSEFSTALTGRTVTFFNYPLCFSEFLKFKKIESADPLVKRAFLDKFLKIGGFPRIAETENLNLTSEYFNRIIFRDVIPRFEIKKQDALKKLAIYLVSNVGKPFSLRKLKDYCGLRHETTVKEYIGYLEQAYLINVVNCFDFSLQKQELKPKKVYSADNAFNAIGATASLDLGRALENAIFLELKRHIGLNDHVFYYRNGFEVDFVYCKGLKPVAIFNVAYEINEEKTMKREVEGLQKASAGLKTSKNYLVTMQPPKFEVPKGVTWISAVDFFEKGEKLLENST